jgi:zinc protease
MKHAIHAGGAFVALLLIGTILAPGFAQTKPQLPVIKFEKYKLSNGLEVILSEDRRLPLVAIDLWYHVGPAYEKPGRTGFAHLFEHMMFQGSKHTGDRPFQILESAGAAQINGTTDFDRTNYFETMPSNQLELALWLESDRMGWLLDKLDEKKMENQRDVVRNERRQGESQPYSLVEEELWHQLFPKSHPYYGEVIGSHADIEAAELNDVRDFFKMYYAPNNATIAIVGDYDPTTIKGLIEKYFGPIPSGPAPEKVNVARPALTQEKRVTVTDKISLPKLYLAWHSPKIYAPGNAEADVLARVLGGGNSSRLYKKLVYEKQIAQDVTVNQQSLMLGSVFAIDATAKPGVRLEDLEKAINEELAAAQQAPPSPAEMERARNTIQAGTILGLQKLGGFGGVADILNQYNHYLGDPGYLAKDLKRYEDVTAADVQKFARTLTSNSRVVVYGVTGEKVIQDVPKRSRRTATSQAMPGGPGNDEWRATLPKPAPLKSPKLPTPKEFKLANGLTVMLLEQHNLPVLTARMAVVHGSEANPVERPGLAAFTAAMLTEGTERRSALQLADDIAQIGASLDGDSSADSCYMNAAGLSWNVDKIFDLLSDAMLHPAFRNEEVERVRQLRLVSLMQDEDDPPTVAARVFAREVYSANSPYGFLETGTESAVKGMKREDLVNFYKTGFSPQNSVLVIAGDITEPQLRTMAEKYFGVWKGNATRPAPPMAKPNLTRRVFIIDTPAAPQSALRIGHAGLERNNPDYLPVSIMNEILGGLFSSRINLNLREVHGFTYGARSRFSFRRGNGPFAASSMVRTDATAAAVKEVFNEFDKMRATLPSADELRMARETRERALISMFETTQQTAGSLADLFIYGLPPDYYSALPQKIQSVDAAAVQRAAQQHLSPQNMVIVVVGDRAKIEPELKQLGYEIRDSNVSGNK